MINISGFRYSMSRSASIAGGLEFVLLEVLLMYSPSTHMEVRIIISPNMIYNLLNL